MISGAAAMLDGSAGLGPAEASAAPGLPAGEPRLQVMFGTGQVGRALAACLAGRGLAVRAVSRHRPSGLADGIDWRAADATNARLLIVRGYHTALLNPSTCASTYMTGYFQTGALPPKGYICRENLPPFPPPAG
jgi:hypothetical protein